MSYAFVTSNTIQSEGGLPRSARRLDNQAWVMGLATATVALQRACGYWEVVDVVKPEDTATHTHDRTLTLPAGIPTVTWVQRPKTAGELADAANAANEASVNTFLANAVALNGTLDLIIATPAAAFTQQGLRDLQAQVKDIARIDRREIRKLLRMLDSAT